MKIKIMKLIDDKIKSALKFKTIAIVGLSRDPNKDSYKVAEYLKANGYHIIPINPFADEILGEKCYKSLLDIPEDIQKTIEIIDIFRPSEEVLPIVEQAIQLKKNYGKPYFIWMQLGIINDKAAELARSVGLEVIMDKCMMIEHKRLERTIQ
ncbi:MAG: CoA-binding protein [Nitrososphaerales archaeon]